MPSPQFNQVAVFQEATYGTAQTTSGGLAYQMTNDGGPTPIMGNITADGMYSGRQAMPVEQVETLEKAWELSFSLPFRTHGYERIFRDAVGTHETAPSQAVAAAGGQPATYSKVFKTDAIGPDGSYSVVLDRYAFLGAGGGNMQPAVFHGCTPRGFSISLEEDNPVNLTWDLVSRQLTDQAASTTVTTAATPAATVGRPQMFHWANSRIKIGAAGAVPTAVVSDLQSASYTQANNLVLKWDIDGDALMRKPYMAQGGVTGSFDLSLNLSDATMVFWNQFRAGTVVAVQMEGSLPPYSWSLYAPYVHLSTGSRGASLTDVSSLSLTGDVVWDDAADAVTLTYATEGATNA